MREDVHRCQADREHELIGEAEKRAHDEGECKGAPRCDYCVLEQERGEESLGG